MLHPLPLPLSSCLGCIPPLIGLPSLRFYAVGSSLFLLSVCFCLCSLFYRDDVLCWLLLARPFLYAFHAHLRFPVDLVWFRLSCDHGWIRSGSVNVRKQQQQQLQTQFLDRRKSFGTRVPCPTCITSKTSQHPTLLIERCIASFICNLWHSVAIIMYEAINRLQLLISPQRTRDATLGEATLTALQLTKPLPH